MLKKIRPKAPYLCVFALLLVLLSGCAGKGDIEVMSPDEREQQIEEIDVLEPFNRYIFEVNIFLDTFFLKPVSTWYAGIVPSVVRKGVGNFFENLKSPVVLANNLLQGETEAAKITAQRFAINSSAGLLGLFDPADGWGYPSQKTDFGQTAGVWGIPHGPFLMLPLFGPSSLRDASGIAVDAVFDPLSYNIIDPSGVLYIFSGWRVVNGRAQFLGRLEDLYQTSVDPYASVRSLYFQSRMKTKNPSVDLDIDALPDIDEYDFSQ
ncbi:MAG: VacJ family lipoprotein [Hyphomicrobiales bacterium]|nr:VacJ family lipoprotein [Hyphomicrobiales bacterium]MCY4049596.1 VacJ family lipoprotein [Hyphomicrobiales bacterium]MCY4053669.1 VacJ family lipoprotein [Hyphomicrobiales bacterium]